MISIIIPHLNEKYLDKTVADIRSKARGDIEICLAHDTGSGMREAINRAVKECQGEYIMKLDAHCMLAEGFDLKLIEAHQDNWVQIPRRKRLDAEKWEVIEDGRPPIDYEFILFENLVTSGGLKSRGFIWGTPWDSLFEERKDVLVDDTPHFQGSCWFMKKDWFNQCGLLSAEYGRFAQESEEILFTTLKNGGKIKVNKNTWYAHLHKSIEARQWFTLDAKDMAKGYEHSYNLWIRDNKELFIKLIDSFPPMPSWPMEWKKILWN